MVAGALVACAVVVVTRVAVAGVTAVVVVVVVVIPVACVVVVVLVHTLHMTGHTARTSAGCLPVVQSLAVNSRVPQLRASAISKHLPGEYGARMVMVLVWGTLVGVVTAVVVGVRHVVVSGTVVGVVSTKVVGVVVVVTRVVSGVLTVPALQVPSVCNASVPAQALHAPGVMTGANPLLSTQRRSRRSASQPWIRNCTPNSKPWSFIFSAPGLPLLWSWAVK